MVNLRQVLVLHVPELLQKPHVLAHSLTVLDEVFFEIHNVLVGRLFGPKDIDSSEIFILSGLDGGEGKQVVRVGLDGESIAHF